MAAVIINDLMLCFSHFLISNVLKELLIIYDWLSESVTEHSDTVRDCKNCKLPWGFNQSECLLTFCIIEDRSHFGTRWAKKKIGVKIIKFAFKFRFLFISAILFLILKFRILFSSLQTKSSKIPKPLCEKD